MNRRDYLLRMGASAAGLMAAGESLLLGQTRKPSNRKSKQSTASAVTTGPLRWPITNVPPVRDAFVTAVYCGLTHFAYHDDGFVDVHFHQGNGGHTLQIQIFKNPHYPNGCDADKIITVSSSERLKLMVAGQPAGNPQVFQVDSNPFNRNSNDPTYADDFRWLPDLHSHDFYPEGYPLRRRPGPRLEVHTGTFYTRGRTKATFKLVDIDGDCDAEIADFGHVAFFMATAITAQSNVVLSDRRGNPLYPFDTANKYQLVFRNLCHSCSAPIPNDCDETRRNEFHFSRKAVVVPAGRLRYGLKLKTPCPGQCDERDFCIAEHGLNDEAPCSGAGFGKANGLP